MARTTSLTEQASAFTVAQQTTVNPPSTRTRKRKTPPTIQDPGDGSGYSPNAADYTPGGMIEPAPGEESADGSTGMSHIGRPLNPGKRAEQNRKAQRAFRERREIHVKELEARSQLLDAALGSADEANCRWEECRALVDTLRVENGGLRAEIAGLRAALGNAAVAAAQFQQHVQQQPTNGTSAAEGETSVGGNKQNAANVNGKERGPGEGSSDRNHRQAEGG